jgi:peptidyl-prolyl cis-trans isomerase SurA
MRVNLLLLFSALWMLTFTDASAQDQPVMVDRVVAVVGNQTIKESDIQNAYADYEEQGLPLNDSLRGIILESLLVKKLMLAQAVKDSITVSEAEINGEIDRRLRYFIMQFGSQKKFEEFYGKTTDAFRFELHDRVKELIMIQKMEGQITQNITVTPADIKAYYASIFADSLPFINAEVEVGQIVIKPTINPELKEYARMELESIRQRVVTGKLDFCVAASTYSKDPGSQFNCGKYENIRRGTFVPAFDAVCFSMKENEISEVFETEYGFHFVQLLARRGEEVDIRHILYEVPVTTEDVKKSKVRLDSIMKFVRLDSLTFCEAAAKFSDDADSKYSCGLILNPYTGTTKIEVNMLGDLDPNPEFPLLVSQMKPGSYSAPHAMATRDGKQAYRVLYLKSRSEPHKANLKDDYQLIQDMALQAKQEKAINEWVKKKLPNTYIRISEDHRHHQFKYPWLNYLK